MVEGDRMNKPERIVSMCKGSVTVTVNDHPMSHRSVRDELLDLRGSGAAFTDAEANSCVVGDAIWNVHAYPHTSVGVFGCYAGTMDEALDAMLELLTQ
jgi:hypothetical protein